MPLVNRTLTSVAGLEVGHATVEGGGSGCTVVLGPFRAAVAVPGMATGTRELHTLAPGHVAERTDAVLLTGGSAFGLAAADGVVQWLAERGRGHPTGVTPVPIVPAAVLFDLAEGRARPGPAAGRAACESASPAPVPEGRVGAGAGATVGKLAGRARADAGGLGSWAEDAGPYRVAALAAVNALGDVVDGEGRVLAGARDEGGRPLDGVALARAWREAAGGADAFPGGGHTTLAVVATDAPLSRSDLGRLARMASAALASRIRPAYTPFDGDVVFAVSTAGAVRDLAPAELLAVGAAAQAALEASVVRAVTEGVR